MIDLKNMNDNILANRWKQRYAEQPQEIKDRLDKLNDAKVEEYQLQVIKKKRSYPEIGDIFQVNPRGDSILHGVVVNNHINNINGDDLLFILMFKPDVSVDEALEKGVSKEDLLIDPVMVGKEYWTRGYFYTFSHTEQIANVKNYGFYSIGKRKFFDEYGAEIFKEPSLLGGFGVATITGIGKKVNQELIILGMI